MDENLWDKKLNRNNNFAMDLVQLLSCDHGIQEMKFVSFENYNGQTMKTTKYFKSRTMNRDGTVRQYWFGPWLFEDAEWIYRTIQRDEFPEFIAYLEKRDKKASKIDRKIKSLFSYFHVKHRKFFESSFHQIELESQ